MDVSWNVQIDRALFHKFFRQRVKQWQPHQIMVIRNAANVVGCDNNNVA